MNASHSSLLSPSGFVQDEGNPSSTETSLREVEGGKENGVLFDYNRVYEAFNENFLS